MSGRSTIVPKAVARDRAAGLEPVVMKPTLVPMEFVLREDPTTFRGNSE